MTWTPTSPRSGRRWKPNSSPRTRPREAAGGLGRGHGRSEGHRQLFRETFGPEAADRYVTLILKAYRDLALDPSRTGTVGKDAELRLYHLRHSRGRGSVSRPRHFVVFREMPEAVRIVRLLHDAMDLPARLSDL